MQRRHFLVSVLAFTLALTAAPAFAAEATPEQIIRDLYKRYDNPDDDAAMQALNAFRVTDLMTDDLAVLYTCVSDNPNGDLPALDWDPFVSGQDFLIKGLKVTAVKTSASQTVTAKFDNLGTQVTVIYDFVHTDAGWRFDNLRYPEDSENAGGFDFRNFVLTDMNRGPEDKAPRNMIITLYSRLEHPPANLMIETDYAPFMPELEALYEKGVKEPDNGDMPLLDWDIFVNGQDSQLRHVYVCAIDRYDGDTITGQTVSAHFWNMDRLTTVIFDFVKTDQWRVADVRYPIGDPFEIGFSLKHYIETDGKEAAVPSAW